VDDVYEAVDGVGMGDVGQVAGAGRLAGAGARGFDGGAGMFDGVGMGDVADGVRSDGVGTDARIGVGKGDTTGSGAGRFDGVGMGDMTGSGAGRFDRVGMGDSDIGAPDDRKVELVNIEIGG